MEENDKQLNQSEILNASMNTTNQSVKASFNESMMKEKRLEDANPTLKEKIRKMQLMKERERITSHLESIDTDLVEMEKTFLNDYEKKPINFDNVMRRKKQLNELIEYAEQLKAGNEFIEKKFKRNLGDLANELDIK